MVLLLLCVATGTLSGVGSIFDSMFDSSRCSLLLLHLSSGPVLSPISFILPRTFIFTSPSLPPYPISSIECIIKIKKSNSPSSFSFERLASSWKKPTLVLRRMLSLFKKYEHLKGERCDDRGDFLFRQVTAQVH